MAVLILRQISFTPKLCLSPMGAENQGLTVNINLLNRLLNLVGNHKISIFTTFHPTHTCA